MAASLLGYIISLRQYFISNDIRGWNSHNLITANQSSTVDKCVPQVKHFDVELTKCKAKNGKK